LLVTLGVTWARPAAICRLDGGQRLAAAATGRRQKRFTPGETHLTGC
jgi:hypothetical protein